MTLANDIKFAAVADRLISKFAVTWQVTVTTLTETADRSVSESSEIFVITGSPAITEDVDLFINAPLTTSEALIFIRGTDYWTTEVKIGDRLRRDADTSGKEYSVTDFKLFWSGDAIAAVALRVRSA